MFGLGFGRSVAYVGKSERLQTIIQAEKITSYRR